MRYGMSTGRAHFNTSYPVPKTNEIDWIALVEWFDPQDQTPPEFGGRYFIGWPNATEIRTRLGFCKWAHGEGAESLAPRNVVPIQRADPARQSRTGIIGGQFGVQDAVAFALEIDRCLAVGDLELPESGQIFVFLEVEDDTRLSPEYWAAWSNIIYSTVLHPKHLPERVDSVAKQPLLPAILCGFIFDITSEKFMPDSFVQACLEATPPRGWRASCFGFWARLHKNAGAPDNVKLDWPTAGVYAQPRGPLRIRYNVPVHYLRVFERLDAPVGPGIPTLPEDGPIPGTLELLTLDLPASGDNDPLHYTLNATNWAADATKPAEQQGEPDPYAEEPAQLGIDCKVRLTNSPNTITCLLASELVATRMPYDPLAEVRVVSYRKKCSFAFRYYSDSGAKRLTREEALAMSRAGIGIAVVWEGNVRKEVQTWTEYVADLVAPFVQKQGADNAFAAFTYATDTIDQPPFTPVYFAVDFPVGDQGYYSGPPLDETAPTTTMDVVLDYFRDIQLGYLLHLQRRPDRPYFIGAYAQRDVNAELYRLGLASHFWQVPWKVWNGSDVPYTHLNAWQISTSASQVMATDNRLLKPCAAFNPGDEEIWFDLNVAWGDPGTFQVFEGV
jgi:hypothetical protein